MTDDKGLPSSAMTAMMKVFIVVDRRVMIVLILPVSGMMLLWQCEVGDVCKLGFTLRTFLGCAWGGSWRNPIDPDHPWPSQTIPALIIPDISRMQLWSRVCVSCPVQVWSFYFVQPVSLGCMTTVWWYSWWSLNFGKLWSWFATLFFQYAWFCVWDPSNSFFETLDARLM